MPLVQYKSWFELEMSQADAAHFWGFRVWDEFGLALGDMNRRLTVPDLRHVGPVGAPCTCTGRNM